MDFLKTLALPQPAEHFQLLLFVTNLIFIVLLPYFGFLLGSSALALYFERKGRRDGSAMAIRFANDLIDTAMFSKSGVAFLGILPALALVFIFIQLLQSTEAIAAGLMAFGFLFLLASTVLLYAYKYTFRVGAILDSLTGNSAKTPPAGIPDLAAYAGSNSAVHQKTGRWGFAFLLIASFLITGAVTIAMDPLLWAGVATVFDLLLLPVFYTRYLYLVAVALGAAGIGALFFFFTWQGGMVNPDPGYITFVRRIAYRLSTISLLAQPILIIATVALMPPAALTAVVFFLSALGLFLLFLAGHFVYAYARDGRSTHVSLAAFTLGLALIAVFSKDQVGVRSATRSHAMNLAIAADREFEELKAKLGVAAPAMKGEDIYNAKCSACHLFDAKKVGPPYKLVIPKYAGKKAQLVAFVLNPVKVDPAYPNMPNQGLRPAEADSIATYLLNKIVGANEPSQVTKK
jgi:cytochrome c